MSTGIFTDGTLNAQTELGMINKCLLAIGEVPLPEGTLVDSLQLGTDGNTASRVVRDTMIEVQSIGWYFNLDYNYKLYRDVDDFISLPMNVIRVDTVDSNRYIAKGGKLYDLLNQTYKLDIDYVEADVIWLVDYPLLPAEAYEYIAARASRKFQEYVIGAPDLTSTTSRAEQDTYVRVQRRQLQTRAYNIQNPRVSTRTTNSNLRSAMYGNKGRY